MSLTQSIISNATFTSARRWIIPAAIGGAAALALLGGCYFVVPQTDAAFVKRFGKVLNPAAGPLMPGLHIKAPFIDDPDLIQVTTDTFELPEKKAFTKDTQELTLRVGVTYRVPPSAAYHLLYEIGRAGNVDIHTNIILLSNEVVREVLSKHTITEIAGEQRETVIAETKGKLSEVLANILHIEIAAVQINSLDFSPQYKEAMNQASLARTKTVAAQQDSERAKVEAQTRITQAKAEADAQAARAEGQARAQLAQAQAEADGNLARARADAEGNLLRPGPMPRRCGCKARRRLLRHGRGSRPPLAPTTTSARSTHRRNCGGRAKCRNSCSAEPVVRQARRSCPWCCRCSRWRRRPTSRERQMACLCSLSLR
ncbi:MAG TPA: SPFH domain-containing protein [Bradyrhizobium sp.]|jgi:regulator of protease activity HflC (stomatin/prohibitin superfamily)|nr:SPFH domain-containing protein [Bradyrhizobium sp.]